MEETRAAWRNYCFRQIPRTSTGFRDLFGRKLGDVELIVGRKKNAPKRNKLGRDGDIIASVSFRGHPRTSVMRVGGRWRMCIY